MGYEKGSVFVYDGKLWLFDRHSTDKEMHQTFILHGFNGEIVEPRAEYCQFLVSPSDLQFIEF